MGRTNKLVDVVFADIVKTEDKISSYDKFLDIDRILSIPESDDLKKEKLEYQRLTQVYTESLEYLAKLEERITQLRCLATVDRDIKLSVIREYIYARTLFYRSGNDVKDIRTIVGKTTVYGNDLNFLYDNKDFMSMCMTKLSKAMKIEINKKTISYATK